MTSMTQQSLSQSDIHFVNNLLVEAGNLASALQDKAGFGQAKIKPTGIATADEQVSQLLVGGLKSRFNRQNVISEEELPEQFSLGEGLIWVVDPIDGTHHYLAKENQYSIMIGLLSAGQPIFGWVYNPSSCTLYYGGTDTGVWFSGEKNSTAQLVKPVQAMDSQHIRIIVGRRDRKNNPWLESLPNTTIIEAGSIGLKVVQIVEDRADVLLHLAGALKVWDTAGPVAIALAAGLDVGTSHSDQLSYAHNSLVHQEAIVVGKQGSLQWFRTDVLSAWPL